MKKLSILLGLFVLFGLFSLSFAQDPYPIDFEVQIDPTKTFIHPDPPNATYYMGNTNVYLDIKMGNSSGQNFAGFQMPFRIYSPNGDGTPIIWYDGGGTDLGGSVERMNGWENYGAYWEFINNITASSWDGYLPDTMSHTVGTMQAGWPDGDPVQTRLRFHFQVPTYGIDQSTDIVTICIDEYDPGWPDYTYEPTYYGFDGPYCFEFLTVVWLPPAFDYVPPSLTTNHDEPYSITLSVNYEWGTMTGAGAIDENDNPIGLMVPSLWGDQIQWIFDPPCSWINDGLNHTVRFYLEDASRGYVYPTVMLTDPVTLTVTKGGAPEIDENYESDILVLIDDTEEVNIELEDPCNDETWSYTVSDPTTGEIVFDNRYLSFTPNDDDDGTIFRFTVRATDCLDQFDEAETYFWARSEVLCGDPNYDSEINILDAVHLINILYKYNMNPGPLEINDVDNSGAVNILDVVYLINFKYKDGPAPNCPAGE